MTIILKSKIEKGSIRLPKKVDLPDGTRVIVRIEPVPKTKEKLKIISELCGAWSDDPTIMPIFKAIDLERHCWPITMKRKFRNSGPPYLLRKILP